MRCAVGLAILLTLAACSGPPWNLSQSPEAIRLRWYPDTTPSVVATQVAQLHCARSGRAAHIVADDKTGSAEVADFRCR